MLTPHHIALHYILSDQTDREHIHFSNKFIDYIANHATRNRNEDDVLNVVSMLKETVYNFYDLLQTITNGFNLKIFFSDGHPNIPLEALTRWRELCSRLDPDSIICFSFIENNHHPDCFPLLRHWKILAPIYNRELDNLLQHYGVSDLHIHFEGSTPPWKNWLNCMHNFATSNDQDIAKAIPIRKKLTSYLLANCTHYLKNIASNDYPPHSLYHLLHNERALLISAWHIASHPQKHQIQHHLFEYIYHKSHYFTNHTQFPGNNPGLKTFKRYFKKSKSFTAKGKESNIRKISDHISFLQEYPLMYYFEPRISPFESSKDYSRYFSYLEKGLETAAIENRGAEYRGKLGFCIHFQRQQSNYRDEIPHASLRKTIDRQSALLQYIRKSNNNIALRIVSIDVADEEKNAPPSVFTPYLRLLRHGNISKEISYYKNQTLDGRHPSNTANAFTKYCYKWLMINNYNNGGHPLHLPRLKITYHAGEDYYHPIDGMRAMDEVIEFAELTSDDCLGHGLAAGDDIDAFNDHCDKAMYMPIEVHLDNLIWLHRKLSSHCDNIYNAEIHYILRKANEITSFIYGEPVQIESLYSMPYFLHRIPPDKEPDNNTIKFYPFLLYLKRLFNKQIRAKLSQTIEVSKIYTFLNKQGALNHIQHNFLLKIAKKKITIEFNPSSNLATGYCGDLTKHALFKYLEVQKDATTATINTDDPGVFYTRIDIEYALIYKAMIDNGFDKSNAIRYLRLIRDNSLHIPRLATRTKLLAD